MRGMRPRTMATSSQRWRRGQLWQSLKIFVGQLGFVFHGAKTVFEEEVGDAGEEADGLDAVLFGFFDERFEDAAACALALGLGLDDDGADLGRDAGHRDGARRSRGRRRSRIRRR